VGSDGRGRAAGRAFVEAHHDVEREAVKLEEKYFALLEASG
jgi:hypothetical protein